MLHPQQLLLMALRERAQGLAVRRWLDQRPEETPERWRDGDKDHRDADATRCELWEGVIDPLISLKLGKCDAAVGQAVPDRDAGGDQDTNPAEQRLEPMAIRPVPRR